MLFVRSCGLSLSLVILVYICHMHLLCGVTTSALDLSKNAIHHSNIKHVEKVQSWEIVVNFVPGSKQVVDILTKSLTKKSFIPCRKKLGFFSIEEVLDSTASSSFFTFP